MTLPTPPLLPHTFAANTKIMRVLKETAGAPQIGNTVNVDPPNLQI